MEAKSRKERRKNGLLVVGTSSKGNKSRKQYRKYKSNRGVFSTLVFSMGLITAGAGTVAASLQPIGAEPDKSLTGNLEDSVIEAQAQSVDVSGTEKNKQQFDDTTLDSAAEERPSLKSNVTTPTLVRKSKEFARQHLQEIGYQGSEFQCLDTLYTRESNWQHTASNPFSGAYGIAQALPGSKMGVVANDWQSNPETQIIWGLQYIKSRYGSPCGAVSFWNANHWY